MQATDSSYERGQKDNWLSSSKSIMDFLLSVVDKYIFNSEWTKSKLKSTASALTSSSICVDVHPEV